MKFTPRLRAIIPEHIRQLKPYKAGRTIDEVKEEFGLDNSSSGDDGVKGRLFCWSVSGDFDWIRMLVFILIEEHLDFFYFFSKTACFH